MVDFLTTALPGMVGYSCPATDAALEPAAELLLEPAAEASQFIAPGDDVRAMAAGVLRGERNGGISERSGGRLPPGERRPTLRYRVIGNEEALLASAAYVGIDAPALPEIEWDEMRPFIHCNVSLLSALGLSVDESDYLRVGRYPEFVAHLREGVKESFQDPKVSLSYQFSSTRDGGDVVTVFFTRRLGRVTLEDHTIWIKEISGAARVVFRPNCMCRQILVYIAANYLHPDLWALYPAGDGKSDRRYERTLSEPIAGFMITDVGG